MKKTTLLKTMLLLCALIVGSSSAWADDSETITFSDIYGSPSSHINVNGVEFNSSNGGLTDCTIVFNKSNGSSNPQYNKSDKVIQFYANNTFTITSSKFIESISCVILSSSYSGSGITASESAYSCKINNKTSLDITNSSGKYAKSFTVTNGEAGQVKIKSMTITYATVVPTITAADVNIDADITSGVINYSITDPDGSTLTAAEKSPGYDWIDNVTVVSAENKVTFTTTANTGEEREGYITLTYGTVTKDVKITQAAPAAMFAVTFSQPANGTLAIKRGETALTSGDEVPTGTTLTIEVTPAERYKLNGSGWQYKVGEAEWTDGVGTTYEVTSDVLFQASIIAKEYQNITWSANGVESVEEVEVGTAIDFSRTATAPTGYVFMGWSASAIDGIQDDAPTFVTEGTCTVAATYYAVFAKQTETEVVVTKDYGFETESDPNWTIDGPARSNEQANTGSYSGKINTNNTYVTFNNKVKVTEFSFAFMRAKDNSNYNVYIETSTDNSTWTAAQTYAMSSFTPVGSFSTKTKTFDGSKELYVRFHCNNTTSVRYVDDVTIKYMGTDIEYSSYCTSIPPVAITITSAGWASFSNASEVEIPEGVTAYYAQKKDESTVTLKEITGGYIPANTGVVLSGAANNYSAAVTTTGATLDEDNLLMPWLTAGGPTETTYYTLAVDSNNKPVFKQSTGGTLAAGKAYLVMPASEGARELNVSFDEEGNTTAIEELKDSKIEELKSCFNLNGQRVAQPTKGLYIVNGRKVVVK